MFVSIGSGIMFSLVFLCPPEGIAIDSDLADLLIATGDAEPHQGDAAHPTGAGIEMHRWQVFLL